MSKKTRLFTMTVLLLFIFPSGFAQTLVLKSGKIIEGKIIEKADTYVKIDIAGVVLTYQTDEIEKIENESSAITKGTTLQDKPQTDAGVSEPAKRAQIGVSSDYLQQGTEKITLDIYNPGQENCPVVIVLHGSAGIEGDRAMRYRNLGQMLMNNGIIAINVHYFENKSRNYSHTVIQTIDYAQNIINANKKKIGLVGYSAGGTIALSVASRDKRVKLLALDAGFLPIGFTQVEAASLPRTFMISGSNDAAMNTLNALSAWFKELNKPYETKIHKGLSHDNIPLSIFDEDQRAISVFFASNF